jgi:hypothetical protein
VETAGQPPEAHAAQAAVERKFERAELPQRLTL